MLSARSDQFVTPRSTIADASPRTDMFVSPRSDYITPRDANGLALASSPRTPHGSDHASTKQDVLVTVYPGAQSASKVGAVPSASSPAGHSSHTRVLSTIPEYGSNAGGRSTATGVAGPVVKFAVDSTVVAADDDSKSAETNLFRFARHGRHDEVESLLRQGVPVDIIDEHGNTFLVVAAQNGHKRIAKIALRQGANMDHQNLRGNTACHYCFAFGYVELGEYLISKGAATNIKNSKGLTCRQMTDASKQ